MFTVTEANCDVGQEATPWDAEALAVLRGIAVAALAMPRDGDIYRFGVDRADVEIIVGFRPGVDRVHLCGVSRVLSSEQGGNSVLIDSSRRRIVLQGVSLAELSAGDVALK